MSHTIFLCDLRLGRDSSSWIIYFNRIILTLILLNEHVWIWLVAIFLANLILVQSRPIFPLNKILLSGSHIWLSGFYLGKPIVRVVLISNCICKFWCSLIILYWSFVLLYRSPLIHWSLLIRSIWQLHGLVLVLQII